MVGGKDFLFTEGVATARGGRPGRRGGGSGSASCAAKWKSGKGGTGLGEGRGNWDETVEGETQAWVKV